MYERFYELDRAPFHITPDPSFLYLSPSHKKALASIIYGVDQRKGFIVVTGEVGLGKTTILRSYLETQNHDEAISIYIFDANVSFRTFLEAVYRELGLQIGGRDVAGLMDGLHNVLIDAYEQKKNVVLVVDEAQNMPVETLEQVRVLSNLETATDKLLQIVLVGQPELTAKLNQHNLRQLKQRVAVRCVIGPLSGRESREYIEHRLQKAGSSTAKCFTRPAVHRIVRYARGIPRVINIVCDAALVAGFAYQKKRVTRRIVNEAIVNLQGPSTSGDSRLLAGSLAALLLVGIALAFFPYRDVLGGQLLQMAKDVYGFVANKVASASF